MKNILIIILTNFIVIISCNEKNGNSKNLEKNENNEKLLNGNIYVCFQNNLTKVFFEKSMSDSVSIVKISKNDTIKISLPNYIKIENLKVNNYILLMNGEDRKNVNNFFSDNDNFFFPYLEAPSVFLFGVNFESKRLIEKSKPLPNSYLTTGLDVFIYDNRNKIIKTSNAFEYDESGIVKNLDIHYYKIESNQFTFAKTISLKVPNSIMEDENLMNKLIDEVVNLK